MMRNLYNRFFSGKQQASNRMTSPYNRTYVKTYEQIAHHMAEKESSNYLLYLVPNNEPEILAEAQMIVDGRNAILLYPADPNAANDPHSRWSSLEFHACFIERGTWVVNKDNALLEVSVGLRTSLHWDFYHLVPIFPLDYVPIVITALAARQEQLSNEQADPLEDALSLDTQSEIQAFFTEKDLHWTPLTEQFSYHAGFSLLENLTSLYQLKAKEIVDVILRSKREDTISNTILRYTFYQFDASVRESFYKDQLTQLANNYPALLSQITEADISSYNSGGVSVYVKGSVLQIAALADPKAESLLKMSLSSHQIDEQLAPIYNAYATMLAKSILDATFSNRFSKDEEIIKRYPSIVSCIIDVEDREGNRIKGNLFQIALASDIHDMRTITRLMWEIPSYDALIQLDLAFPPGKLAENSRLSKLREFANRRFIIEHGEYFSSEQKERFMTTLKENIADWIRKETLSFQISYRALETYYSDDEENDVKFEVASRRWRPPTF